MRALLAVATCFALACSNASGGGEPLPGGNGPDASSDGGGNEDSGGFNVDATPGEGGKECVPPDMLIALDRTLTMHRKPDGTTPTDAPNYESSKWFQAVTAIEGLVKAPLDNTIRFGLELWPKEAPGCVTLAERVSGKTATNPSCETGEVLVSPSVGTGAKIAATLDPSTTKICVSTPTGAGLIEAASHLATIKAANRPQYILLVTDGADWDQSCPTPDPVEITKQNAAKDVKTYVLGFSAEGTLSSGGVGVPFLNDMACAGRTAPDFGKNCKSDGKGGHVAVDAKNGPQLFLKANDGAGLTAAMKTIATSICCDCPR